MSTNSEIKKENDFYAILIKSSVFHDYIHLGPSVEYSQHLTKFQFYFKKGASKNFL